MSIESYYNVMPDQAGIQKICRWFLYLYSRFRGNDKYRYLGHRIPNALPMLIIALLESRFRTRMVIMNTKNV